MKFLKERMNIDLILLQKKFIIIFSIYNKNHIYASIIKFREELRLRFFVYQAMVQVYDKRVYIKK